MIFQHFNLLSSRTAFDNVALPLEIAGAKSVEIKQRGQVAARIGRPHRQARPLPAELSGGQKQRVSGIARALATKPKACCPTSSFALDPETTRSILDLLGTIEQELGVTFLLITPMRCRSSAPSPMR